MEKVPSLCCMQDPKVYIVIVNYRKWTDAWECLVSVLNSRYTNYTVLLVDNDSGNESLAHLTGLLQKRITEDGSLKGKSTGYSFLKREAITRELKVSALPQITFIQNDVNAGFAAGNNIVLDLLQHEDAYIWLLNPDMVIKEDTLSELVKFTVAQPPGSITGAEVRSYKGNQDVLFYGGGKISFNFATVKMVNKRAGIPDLDYISGSCLFTYAGNFKKLGLLPEKYFLYWEETDWCYTAKQKGFTLNVCSSAVCYDKISSVIGKSFTAHYYYVRNGLLFISRFREKKIPVVLFFAGARFLKRLVSGQWRIAGGILKGVLDFLKMKKDEAE